MSFAGFGMRHRRSWPESADGQPGSYENQPYRVEDGLVMRRGERLAL